MLINILITVSVLRQELVSKVFLYLMKRTCKYFKIRTIQQNSCWQFPGAFIPLLNFFYFIWRLTHP